VGSSVSQYQDRPDVDPNIDLVIHLRINLVIFLHINLVINLNIDIIIVLCIESNIYIYK